MNKRANKILATGPTNQIIYKNAKVAAENLGMSVARVRAAVLETREVTIGTKEYYLNYLFDTVPQDG